LFHGECGEVVVFAEFALEMRAECGSDGRREFAGGFVEARFFGGKAEERREDVHAETARANRKKVFVRFARGNVAHRARGAEVSAAAVRGPVVAVDDVDELRRGVDVAGEAESGGVADFFDGDGGSFERGEDVAKHVE
jgi:hypothetical protein